MSPTTKHEHKHSPLIALDWPRIIGCTCGWRTPPGTSDSDTTFTWHAAIAIAAEGRSS